MGAINGPYIIRDGDAAQRRYSAFDERIHQRTPNDTFHLSARWMHTLRSFKVKPELSEAQVQATLTKELGDNNLDELVVKTDSGLQIVYGRAVAPSIAVGDQFVSNEVVGTVVSVNHEVSRDLGVLRIKEAARTAVAGIVPFCFGIPAAVLLAGTSPTWGPFAGIAAVGISLACGLRLAISGVPAALQFAEGKKRFAADVGSYAPLAEEPNELVERAG